MSDMPESLRKKRDEWCLSNEELEPCGHYNNQDFCRSCHSFNTCYAEMKEELETERMRLVACGVAAMCNTKESIEKQGIAKDNPYWSVSYGDVCDAVAREMKLIEREKRLIEVLDECEGAMIVAQDSMKEEGISFSHVSPKGLITRDCFGIALEKTRKALEELVHSLEA